MNIEINIENTKKNKKATAAEKSSSHPATLLFKILIFILSILFSALGSSRKKRYKPNLQERVMGERISVRRYYIPDDK